MFFKKTMKKMLAERGYKHCSGDNDFSRHGDYARNIQYAFSKEHNGSGHKIVDVVFLSADMYKELFVIGFFRENTSIENGVMVNQNIAIPLAKFSMDEFEKQLDRIIPKGAPVRQNSAVGESF